MLPTTVAETDELKKRIWLKKTDSDTVLYDNVPINLYESLLSNLYQVIMAGGTDIWVCSIRSIEQIGRREFGQTIGQILIDRCFLIGRHRTNLRKASASSDICIYIILL
jgi:hypothetical protein